MVVCAKKFLIAFALVFLTFSPTFQLLFIILTIAAYFVLLLRWAPYKSKYANQNFRRAEFFFVIGLFFLIYISVKKDEIAFETARKIGWVSAYILGFAWFFMTYIFFKYNEIKNAQKVAPMEVRADLASKSAKPPSKDERFSSLMNRLKESSRKRSGEAELEPGKSGDEK